MNFLIDLVHLRFSASLNEEISLLDKKEFWPLSIRVSPFWRMILKSYEKVLEAIITDNDSISKNYYNWSLTRNYVGKQNYGSKIWRYTSLHSWPFFIYIIHTLERNTRCCFWNKYSWSNNKYNNFPSSNSFRNLLKSVFGYLLQTNSL